MLGAKVTGINYPSETFQLAKGSYTDSNGDRGQMTTLWDYTTNGLSGADLIYDKLTLNNKGGNTYGRVTVLNPDDLGTQYGDFFTGRNGDDVGGTSWMTYNNGSSNGGTMPSLMLNGANDKMYFSNGAGVLNAYFQQNGSDTLFKPNNVGTGKLYIQGQTIIQSNATIEAMLTLKSITQPLCGVSTNGSIIRNQTNCLTYCNGVAWKQITC
jgi:hypothetical protein